jgi:hypothetical protein
VGPETVRTVMTATTTTDDNTRGPGEDHLTVQIASALRAIGSLRSCRARSSSTSTSACRPSHQRSIFNQKEASKVRGSRFRSPRELGPSGCQNKGNFLIVSMREAQVTDWAHSQGHCPQCCQHVVRLSPSYRHKLRPPPFVQCVFLPSVGQSGPAVADRI